MSETALSEEAMRNSLLDIRLPPETAVAPYADLMLAAGLGGGAALLLVGAVRLMSRRKSGAPEMSVAARIAALRAQPEEARRVGFLHLLKEIAPERYAALQPLLYRPGAAVDVEKEVEAHV